MAIFEVPEPQVPEAQQMAVGMLKFGNALADQLVSLHRQSRAMLWGREGWTVADLQACVDAMGANAPAMFAQSAAFAQFLLTQYPGSIDESEAASLVPYTIQPDRQPQPIVFDPNGRYPTEPEPEPDPADEPTAPVKPAPDA